MTIPSKYLPAPECVLNAQGSRDNSLSIVNNSTGRVASYMWTLPADTAGQQVVVRVRYNISTGEFTDPKSGNEELPVPLDARFNAAAAGKVTTVPVWQPLGLSRAEIDASILAGNANQAKAAAQAASEAPEIARNLALAAATTRGYVLAANPAVDIFGPLVNGGNRNTGVGKIRVQLAINLAQWGRTFEDRSPVFSVISVPRGVVATALASDKRIICVCIVGRKGNQAQTYPAVELQFTQPRINAQVGDLVHCQWALSRNNPANNAVNGGANGDDGIFNQTDGVDEANVVMLDQASYQAVNSVEGGNPFQIESLGRMSPAPINGSIMTTINGTQQVPFLGLPADKLEDLAEGGVQFNSGPLTIASEGDFAYISTKSSLAIRRMAKGHISVVGPQYSAFKSSPAFLSAVSRQAAAVELPKTTDPIQSLSQLSAQTPSSQNPNFAAAQAAQSREYSYVPPGAKVPGWVIAIAVLAVLTAIILVSVVAALYWRSKQASKSPKDLFSASTATPKTVDSSTALPAASAPYRASTSAAAPTLPKRPAGQLDIAVVP